MSLISSIDLSAFLAYLFAPGLDSTAFRARAARILREAVEGHIVCFASMELATRQLHVDFDPFLPEVGAAFCGFAQYMAQYPCFNFDPNVAGGKPFLRGDFLSDEAFYTSPIYLEGFKLANVSDHAAIPIPCNEGFVYFISVEKCDGKTFGASHLRMLTILQPHLSNAYNLAQSLDPLEQTLRDSVVRMRLGVTPREADTLVLIAEGKSNEEIAVILGIRLSTVKGHVSMIFNKLGVDNRHAALLRAYDLTHPPTIQTEPTTLRLSEIAAEGIVGGACAPSRQTRFVE